MDEIKLGSVGNQFSDHFNWVDENWNVYWPKGNDSAHTWVVIPNEGKEKDMPVWNWDHQVPGGAFAEQEHKIIQPGPASIFATSDGAVYMSAKGWPVASDIAPLCWPNSNTTSSRFVKWNKQGLEEFSVGVHTTKKDGSQLGGFADIRGIVNQVRGNIVVRDACSSAMVFTTDGLYAGAFCNYCVEKRPKDAGLEKRLLVDAAGQPTPPWTDDAQECEVIESTKGEVFWGANDTQNTMIYRIQGWDNWERQNGKLSLATAAPSAQWQGKGLKAEIFSSPDLTGAPVLRRTDPDIWFGPMWGDHRPVLARNGFFKKGEEPAGFNSNAFSGRWTGFVEAPVSEDFNFVVLAYGAGDSKYNPPHTAVPVGSRVRLWVGGNLIVDSWDGVKQQKVDNWYRTMNLSSGPIALKAGTRVPIKLEYSAAGEGEAHLHLFWESPNWDLRHIPAGLLYPE
jgi:hypothetical protein